MTSLSRHTTPARVQSPGDVLEESLTVLQKSMEQARSSFGKEVRPSPRRNMQDTGQANVPESPSSWLLGMFHQRERDHEAEKASLQDHLLLEKQKKHTYKNQLKDALKDRIGWLETQLQSAQQSQCLSEQQHPSFVGRKEDPPPVLPTDSELTPDHTATTIGSSTISIQPDSQHHGRRKLIISPRNMRTSPRQRVRKKILSPQQGQEGYEITFQTDPLPSPNSRIKQLERTLQQTIDDFELERTEWLRAVEEATTASVAGKQLSAQQERQLRELEKQVEIMPDNERTQWQEKTRVLKELLELTEKQQSNELKEWEEEVKVFELTVSKLSSEREALVSKAKTTEKELAEAKAKATMTVKELVDVKAKLEELSSVQAEQQVVFDKTNAELNELREENEQLALTQEEWNREKEATENTVSQLISDKNSMRKQITMLRKHIHGSTTDRNGRRLSPQNITESVQLEEKLDRVSSERDAYMEEANQKEEENQKLQEQIQLLAEEKSTAEELLDHAREQWENAVAAGEREREITKEWEGKMATKDQELNDMRAHVESERRRVKDELERERTKLRNTFAVKETALKLESEQQIQELRLKHEEELHQAQLTDGELAIKLKDAADKRNDLVQRLRKIELQRGKEKGEWKLQLETALAQTRKAQATVQELKDKLESQAKRHEQDTKNHATQLSQSLRELQEKLKAATEEAESKLAQKQENLEAVKKDAEREIAQMRAKLREQLGAAKEDAESEVYQLQEKHTFDLQQKESELNSELNQLRETHKNELQQKENEQKSMMDQLREKHANELQQKENEQESKLTQLMEKHTGDLRHKDSELEAMREEKENVVSELQEQKEKSAHLAGSKAEARVLTDRMNDMKTRLKEVWEVKEKRELQAEEYKAQLDHERSEVLSLTRKLNDTEKRLNDTEKRFEEASEINEKRARELDEWKTQAEESQEDARDRADQVFDLTSRLEDLQNYHDSSTKSLEAQIERFKSEINRIKSSGESSSDSRGPAQVALEDHKNVICDAVEELRKDVVSIRDSTVSPSKISTIRDDLGQLQVTLDDVVAELTLETEAMYETRTAVEALRRESIAAGKNDASGFHQQQEVMFAQMAEMNDNVKRLFELNSSSDEQDAVRLQLVAELKLKEEILLKYNADLDALNDTLAAEVEKRERAEAEVAALNDQADAYSEELIRLQSQNTTLQATLKEAERKMISVLGGGEGDGDVDSLLADDNAKNANEPGNSNESPLLDDALALAESLSQIVQGNTEDGKEISVLKMLETLSERMDQHERKSPALARNRSSMGDEKGHMVTFTGAPSAPQVPEEILASPAEHPIGAEVPANGGSALKILVEQLHARCQLLERERLEMMEVTLDLLESARQSSKAELDAALATARRKASEDMIRMGEEVYKDRECLYNKLCSQCVHGLMVKPSDSLNSLE